MCCVVLRRSSVLLSGGVCLTAGFTHRNPSEGVAVKTEDEWPISAGSVGSEKGKRMNETTAPDAPVQTQTALDAKGGGSVGDHERQREETD